MGHRENAKRIVSMPKNSLSFIRQSVQPPFELLPRRLLYNIVLMVLSSNRIVFANFFFSCNPVHLFDKELTYVDTGLAIGESLKDDNLNIGID